MTKLDIFFLTINIGALIISVSGLIIANHASKMLDNKKNSKL